MTPDKTTQVLLKVIEVLQRMNSVGGNFENPNFQELDRMLCGMYIELLNGGDDVE